MLYDEYIDQIPQEKTKKIRKKRDWSRLESEVCIFLQGSVFSRFTSISDLKLGTALACSTSKLLFLFHFPLPFLQGMYLPSPAQRAQYQAGFHQNFHLPEYALHCRLCCCQTFFSFLEENSKFRREKKRGGGGKREVAVCSNSAAKQENSRGCTSISPKKAWNTHRLWVTCSQGHSSKESQMHLGLSLQPVPLSWSKITVRNWSKSHFSYRTVNMLCSDCQNGGSSS